jgi:hypothetical protein
MWEIIENPDRYLARLHLGVQGFRGARKQDLPFYENAHLVQILVEDGACFGVASENDVFWLDGNARSIHEANNAIGLRLDETNAAQYLKFFCDHMEGNQGWFDVRAVIGGIRRNEAGDYLFKCIIGYGAAVYGADMRVGQNGEVEMLSDEVIRGPGKETIH